MPFRFVSRPIRVAAAVLIGLVCAATNAARGAGELDHAAMIRAWGPESFERGERLYNAVCIVCHGTPEKEGSLPTSRHFWKDPLKRGKDPFSLFNTVGDGFDQMPAQPWMTPQQRYDVVHYIREAFIKRYNASEYFPVTPDYLAGLPKDTGKSLEKTEAMIEFERGPKYLRMDFGPVLFWTIQVGTNNIAYKGIAVRLDPGPGGISAGNAWMLYDHDTMRVAAAWYNGQFVDWKGIAFDGSHSTHLHIAGRTLFVNPVGPGWAHPGSESFDDPRFLGRDGKPYGPLPRDWAHYKGLYLSGHNAVIEYTVGDARVLERPGIVGDPDSIAAFSRTLNIGKSSRSMLMRIAPSNVAAIVVGDPNAKLIERDGFHMLQVPAEATPLAVKVLVSSSPASANHPSKSLGERFAASSPIEDLTTLTRGGRPRWPGSLITQGQLGDANGPFAVDTITPPDDIGNPWQSWMRFGGFDFFSDTSRAAICTWNGDVWIVSGITEDLVELQWKRIATGLFQPLGLRIVNDIIYVTCRDQIARLHDLNNDGEIDRIENFNNDHQVTEHFHEFAMGLQTDADGNFYYAKSARHALPALVPHHGTLLRVTKDGARTDTIAHGFRAANGVCINNDGTFFVTDQEGHWVPKNRINWVRPNRFYGNMWVHNPPEDPLEMEPPLVWITNEMDRSPAELLWVDSKSWGPFRGALLNLSYGTGRIYLVPHETVNGQPQGGVVPMPIPDFPTGIMRGRFHPDDGHLYTCGMVAWAANPTAHGGFYRVRYTGKPALMPIHLQTRPTEITLVFSDPLDATAAADPSRYAVRVWSLKRSAKYGSNHFDERVLRVANASVSNGGRTVSLHIPELEPTWCMEIRCSLRGVDGTEVSRRIHNTIHRLPPASTARTP